MALSYSYLFFDLEDRPHEASAFHHICVYLFAYVDNRIEDFRSVGALEFNHAGKTSSVAGSLAVCRAGLLGRLASNSLQTKYPYELAHLRQLPHCRAEFALFVRDREDVGAHAANTMINLRFAVPHTFPCNRPRTHDRLRRPWRWLRGGRQGWVISGRRGWGISGLLCGHWGL